MLTNCDDLLENVNTSNLKGKPSQYPSTYYVHLAGVHHMNDIHVFTKFNAILLKLAPLCSSDYQRISEHYKKKKNPPPWPSHDNRQIKTPPRRIHTSESTGSLPPTPQHHQQQQPQGQLLSASAGSGGLAMNPRDRLNTIDIRPQPRMPDGGYDTYDVSMM